VPIGILLGLFLLCLLIYLAKKFGIVVAALMSLLLAALLIMTLAILSRD